MNSPVRSLLVTGGAGFIGANFVHYWHREHPTDNIVVVDALTYAGNRSSIAALESTSKFRFVHGDIRDQSLTESILRSDRIDTLVHFAAESHVDRSILGPDPFIETNVVGTHALLRACRQVWLEERAVDRHRFHHVSTDEVYGSLEPADPAFSELTPYAPNSPYAASKAASDHLVRAYAHTYGLDTTTTNCSNNYGPFQFPEKLVPLVTLNILEGSSIPVYGDGRNVRDWLHVTDHCRAIDFVLTKGRTGETYNVGGGAELENLALVGMLCDLTDAAVCDDRSLQTRFPNSLAAVGRSSRALIQLVPDRPGHDRRYAINGEKIARECGFVPRVGVADGLRATIDWFLGNEGWWRAVMDGSYKRWIDRQYAGGTRSG
jgi:dTDP-glucose 4,6-dehydratase